ncbi:hypothetical protein CRM22_001626 [Opisthorchis felineus]|uniref:Centriolar and ciliogenesis-associated protein HYLS1 C-terminal domain-containing protein n=1 Tax=Opisthorchis felineus TaxID=147828 RepID=A0A4S2M9Z8_OPIFE|nr:hypothetical protein CRM22_001626 [Opisthorchis felineus]
MPVPSTPAVFSDTDCHFTFDEIREQLAHLGVTDLTKEQLWRLKKHLDNAIARDLKQLSLQYSIADIAPNSDDTSSEDSLAVAQITSSTPNQELGQPGDQQWNNRSTLLPTLSAVSSTSIRSKTSNLANSKQPDVLTTGSTTTSSGSDIEDGATLQSQTHLKRYSFRNSFGGSKMRKSSQFQLRGAGESIDSDENTDKDSRKLLFMESKSRPSCLVPAPQTCVNGSPHYRAVVPRTCLNDSSQGPPSKIVRNLLLIHQPKASSRSEQSERSEQFQVTGPFPTKNSHPVSVQDISQDSDRSTRLPSDSLRVNSANGSRRTTTQCLLEPSHKSVERRARSAVCEHRPLSSSGDLSPHSMCSISQVHPHPGLTTIGLGSPPNTNCRLLKTTRGGKLNGLSSAHSRQPRSTPDSRLARFADDPVENVYDISSREHRISGTSEVNRPLSLKSLHRPSSLLSQPRPRLHRLDPVSRYHSYRRSWLTYRAPGEDARRVLRWNIKTAMMHREVPLLQRNFAEVVELFGESAADYLRRERQHNLKALNLSYIPPTSKRHDFERWRVRSTLDSFGGARIH